jgi:hypothetical protein
VINAATIMRRHVPSCVIRCRSSRALLGYFVAVAMFGQEVSEVFDDQRLGAVADLGPELLQDRSPVDGSWAPIAMKLCPANFAAELRRRQALGTLGLVDRGREDARRAHRGDEHVACRAVEVSRLG